MMKNSINWRFWQKDYKKGTKMAEEEKICKLCEEKCNDTSEDPGKWSTKVCEMWFHQRCIMEAIKHYKSYKENDIDMPTIRKMLLDKLLEASPLFPASPSPAPT